MTRLPADPAPRRSSILRAATSRPRLMVSVAVAFVVYMLEPMSWPRATRLLIMWNIGTILDTVLNLRAIASATSETIRYRAAATEDGKWAILALTSFAVLVALAAIFAQLAVTKDMHGPLLVIHLGLAGLTIVSAWFFIHMTFALHYAHEYYDYIATEDGSGLRLRAGISFPETKEPDYWDFLYFAFIIGVAAQTADVAITSREIRRTSLVHSILAFFFNSAILAVTINVVAGFI